MCNICFSLNKPRKKLKWRLASVLALSREVEWGQDTGARHISTQPGKLSSSEQEALLSLPGSLLHWFYSPLFSHCFLQQFYMWPWRYEDTPLGLKRAGENFWHPQQPRGGRELWWQVGWQARRVVSCPFILEKSSEMLDRERRCELDEWLRERKDSWGLLFT